MILGSRAVARTGQTFPIPVPTFLQLKAAMTVLLRRAQIQRHHFLLSLGFANCSKDSATFPFLTPSRCGSNCCAGRRHGDTARLLDRGFASCSEASAHLPVSTSMQLQAAAKVLLCAGRRNRTVFSLIFLAVLVLGRRARSYKHEQGVLSVRDANITDFSKQVSNRIK